jgi:hypothetical protein
MSNDEETLEGASDFGHLNIRASFVIALACEIN